MLMLGESILSLLIVDVPEEDSEYYGTFFCSLLTVIFLHYLHFRSMPHDADDHAIRRSKNRGMGWVLCKYMYSCALVALGAAFTFFVTSFSYEVHDEDDPHRRSVQMTTTTTTAMDLSEESIGRFLAGGGGSSIMTSEEFAKKEQTAAHLFSISLSVVFLGLEGMSFMNVGLEGSRARVQCPKSLQYDLKGLFLTLVRIGLLVFCATLSQWETNPQALVSLGLGTTIGQIVIRLLGCKYLNKKLEQVAVVHHDDGRSGTSPHCGKHAATTSTPVDNEGHEHS